MAAPAFYQQATDEIARVQNKLTKYESQLAELYERWNTLEEKENPT